MKRITAKQLWACFDVWATTGRTANDKRHAMRCKAKALIAEDKGQ